MTKPFTFLAGTSGAWTAREVGERARAAEALGVTTFVLPDHLVDQPAPVPYLAAVAAQTERIRISAFVHNNDLRHPAVLAQELATLDRLSQGRLDVAIGAGWNRAEYDAIGLRFDPIRVRQARLAEAVAVLKGCFAPGPFSFAGEHYTLTDHTGLPEPAQRPHPPFLIGGGGRTTLSLAAREAQTVGLAPRILPGGRPDARSFTWAATEEKVAWVREAAGDRFDELTLNAYPSFWPVTVTDDVEAEAQRVADALEQRSGTRLSTDEVIGSPHLLIGSHDHLVAKLTDLRDRLGISSFMLGDVDALAPVVRRLAGT
ncbi:TIGR03621 family F420-dependent LLM class oxidoreductase [Thalassiella azotivora]